MYEYMKLALLTLLGTLQLYRDRDCFVVEEESECKKMIFAVVTEIFSDIRN